MKINYGIWKYETIKSRKKTISQNGNMEVEGNWDDKDFHKKVMDVIREKHPGWMVHGYCPTPEKKSKI